MFFGRFFIKVPVLALAGALAQKKIVPTGAGTLPTHTPLFVAMLVGVIIIVGALTFIPALALGPSSSSCSRKRMRTMTPPSQHTSAGSRASRSSTRRSSRRAVVDSFRKLDPRHQVRNPVMFVVEVGSLMTTGLFVQALAGSWARHRPGSSSRSPSGSGSPCSSRTSPRRWPRAAARRRPTRSASRARTSRPSRSRRRAATPRPSAVAASQLRKGDLVLVRSGRLRFPATARSSKASPRSTRAPSPARARPSSARAAATAAPSPAARASCPTGSSSASRPIPGETFLDRMIAMVEGAKRQKTPNEIALDILLAALTIIFLLATVTLLPFSLYSVARGRQGRAHHHHGAGRAPRLPHSDDHRRPAVRHRHRGHGPHDPGERHRDERARGRGGRRRRRAAARQDRHDHARQPPGDGVPPGPGRAPSEELADAAQLSSLADETPEGRSIVVLAKEKYGIRERDVHALKRHVRPVHGADAHERRRPRRTARSARARPTRSRPTCRPRAARSRPRCARHVEAISKQGGTPLVVAEGRDVARRHRAQGHRQGRHQGALRRAPPHGHQDRHDHRRQPADRRRDRGRGGRRRLPRPGHAGDEARRSSASTRRAGASSP